MITLTHVRGNLAPTSNVKASNLPRLAAALQDTKLSDFTKEAISENGKVEFDHSSKHGPHLAELVLNLQKFIKVKEVKELNLYGTLMVIMETNDDFPKLYRITVEKGVVTYKEGSLSWKDKAA